MELRRLGKFRNRGFRQKERGTKIVAKLKKECDEFSKVWRVKSILEKYSAYVDFPIELNGEKIGTHRAIWLKSKSELKKRITTNFQIPHAFRGGADRLPVL